MVRTDDDVRVLLPWHDCGLCGAPTCATFARRLTLGRARLIDCPPLDPSKSPQIDAVLSEGAVTGVCDDSAPRGTIAINPCADGGKVTLETQLKCKVKERGCSPFDLLDFQYLGGYLSGLGDVRGLSASLEMGYAKFDIAGQRVHIFKSGKLIVRRADSRDSAMGILSTVAKAVWPAVICPDTGLTLSSSFYGQGCPFAWKPHEFACPGAQEGGEDRGFGGLPRAEAYFNGLASGSSPPGRELSAELGQAFSLLDSPRDAPRLLAVAGALEALARAGEVSEGWEAGRLAKAVQERTVLPSPVSSGDWRRHKAEYNLHLASSALLSVLP